MNIMFEYGVQEGEIAFVLAVALVCPPCSDPEYMLDGKLDESLSVPDMESNQRSRCISTPAMQINFKLHFLLKQLCFPFFGPLVSFRWVAD